MKLGAMNGDTEIIVSQRHKNVSLDCGDRTLSSQWAFALGVEEEASPHVWMVRHRARSW